MPKPPAASAVPHLACGGPRHADARTGGRRRALAAALVAASMVAGCLGAGGEFAPPPDGPRAIDWATAEARPPRDVAFPAATRAGLPLVVRGNMWLPDAPGGTVLLAVHGSGGLPLDIFGPAGVPGYSFAHRFVEAGRAVVAIHRPGYGGSDPVGTQDEHAWLLAQVASGLRSGSYAVAGGDAPAFARVVGAGHSMGAHVTMVSQGEHAPFDAIVPIGWSHGGYPYGWWECMRPLEEPPFSLDCILAANHTDPAILAWAREVAARAEDSPDDNLATWVADTGSWRSAHPALRAAPAPDRDELSAAKVAGPVLLLLGAEDRLVHPSTQEDEEAVFASTDDLTVLLFEATAHWVFHHLNRDEVDQAMLDWLDGRGL